MVKVTIDLKQLFLVVMNRGSGDDSDDGDFRDRKSGFSGIGVDTKVRPKTKKPSLYKVLLLNDDYTPMEFVIHVLERFFAKQHEDYAHVFYYTIGTDLL